MRLVIQRVKKAKVMVGALRQAQGRIIAEIGKGLLVLAGIHAHDTRQQAEFLAEKLLKLRVINDERGKMNLTVGEVNGSILVVSQFTLYADTKGSNRPDFSNVASREIARPIYEHFVEKLREKSDVKTGVFGEYMKIDAELDGPVTIIMES